MTIRDNDGAIIAADVAASVQSKPGRIFIDDVTIRIEVGYVISRVIPSGVSESYIVEDPGYHAGIVPGLPASYQIKVRRSDPPTTPRLAAVHYHASGPNSRINIASLDNSRNTVGADTEELFNKLLEQLKTIDDEAERTRMLSEAQDLKSEVGKPSFSERYQRFVASAAAHITILTPFIPQLTALIHH